MKKWFLTHGKSRRVARHGQGHASMNRSKLSIRIVVIVTALSGVPDLPAGEGRLELSQSMMPITITQSGSYVVTEDLQGTSGNRGIHITASDVSIDLNGFDLVGVGASLGGIDVTGTHRNISVRNGTVRNWGSIGVDIDNASNCVVTAVRAVDNGNDGFRVRGNLLVDCIALGNSGDGFQVTGRSILLRCIARDNGANGIITGNDCALSLCAVRTNKDAGIVTGVGCSVLRCTARDSGESGISVGAATAVSGCAVHSNGGHGIESIGGGARISDCTVYANTNYGIAVGKASLVKGNALQSNAGGGVLVSNHAYVVNNAIEGSTGAAGIKVLGVRSRIEGNHLSNNGIGIDVDGSDCVVVKNTAVGNTDNYDITGGNHFEEDSPAGTLPDKPWVNFEF